MCLAKARIREEGKEQEEKDEGRGRATRGQPSVPPPPPTRDIPLARLLREEPDLDGRSHDVHPVPIRDEDLVAHRVDHVVIRQGLLQDCQHLRANGFFWLGGKSVPRPDCAAASELARRLAPLLNAIWSSFRWLAT